MEENIKKGNKEYLVFRVQNRKKQLWWSQKVAACLEQEKLQQSNIQIEVLKSVTREKSKQREVKRTFKILKEVQLNIEIEKVNTHKSITVKVLLDNSTTRMFMDRKIVVKHGFRL